ncbi:hypothetical protein DENSPDRAFT_874960 [Dentipellis sp. KUC8613]|nr:hypothetical protein DENSPDRAFT_874960 [Dentipellis sp. KUC8613]
MFLYLLQRARILGRNMDPTYSTSFAHQGSIQFSRRTTIEFVISATSSLSALQQRIAAVTTFDDRLSNELSPIGVSPVPGEGLWKYFGNYDLARSVQPLTTAEAHGLDKTTVRVWADMLSNKTWDCHAEFRVRIWLRKIGAEVTESEVAHNCGLLRDRKSPIDLNKKDIIEALRSWKETWSRNGAVGKPLRDSHADVKAHWVFKMAIIGGRLPSSSVVCDMFSSRLTV